MTHFEDTENPGHTLCGVPWDGVVLNDRPARCPRCSDAWAAQGWTFPLPATVYREDQS